WMGDGDVHAVGIIIADVLPIHWARAERDAAIGDELLKFERFELFRIRRHHLLHAGQALREADEDEPVGDLLIDGFEAERARIEPFEALPFRRTGEAAVELVAPSVIWADKAMAARAACFG